MTTLSLHVDRPSPRDAILDWLQMLSGATLVLFMWAHMLLVSSVIISPAAMNAIAGFFERTYLAQVGGPLVGFMFLAHFILAARKMPFREQSQRTFWHHATALRHPDTWLWLVQVVTALGILVLGSVHLWTVLTDLPITAAKSAARIQGGWWLAFYLLLLPMVELHVSIGFYRICVKWGLVRAKDRPGAKRLENILFGIFVAIGLLTLARFVFLTV